MSGIVGIVHFDGAPVDRQLLEGMTAFMALRGPDAQEIWIEGSAGLGHTLLKTTEEAERERQPFTLDGRIWIVADARVDARRELIAKLKAKGHEDLSLDSKDDATDAELILRSYLAWNEACVEHLLGDFAFAIWDGPKQRLFCARDHLGIKPFFYANIGQKFIFSSSLDCVRQHPAVSDRLNDLAIADFLLFDWEAALRCIPAPLLPVRGLEKYVDPIRVPHQVNQDMMAFWADMRPQFLNYWLRNLQSKPDSFRATNVENRYFAEHIRGGCKEPLKTSAKAEVA